VAYHWLKANYSFNSICTRPSTEVAITKWTFKINWQHRVHMTTTNKAKTQHNMYWTPLK